MHVSAPNDSLIDPEVESIEYIHIWITRICPTIIYIIGLPGNTLTILTLRRRPLRNNFVSLFLSWVCVGNIISLLSGLLRYWILGVFHNFDYSLVSRFWCLFPWFVLHSSVAFSNWLIVVVTFCRYYFMKYPDRIHNIHFSCTLALLYVMLVFLATSLPSLYFTIIRLRAAEKLNSSELKYCLWERGTLMTYVHTTFYGLLPTITVIIINCLILQLHVGRVNSLTFRRSSASATNRNLLILVVASNMQMVLTFLPISIYYIIVDRVAERDTPLGHAKFNLGYTLLALVQFTSFATSWMIYCCFGSRFRRELSKLIGPICRSDSYPVHGIETFAELSNYTNHPRNYS